MLTQTDPYSPTSAIAVPPCTDRPLTYYLSTGKYYRYLQQSLLEAAEGTIDAIAAAKEAWTELQERSHPSGAIAPCLQMLERWETALEESKEARKEAKQAWNEFLKNSGQASFIKHCLTMLKQWEDLEESLQAELSSIPFPDYLTCTAAVNLLKVPAEAFGTCLSRLREYGELTSKYVTEIAKLFHFRRVTHLVLEEVMPQEGWTFITKKYKFNPEELEEVQQLAGQLAIADGGTVFVDHVVQVLADKGHDPSRILPKPKQRDDVESLRAEVEELRQQLQQLQGGAIITQFVETAETEEEAVEEITSLILGSSETEETEETPAEIPEQEIEKETLEIEVAPEVAETSESSGVESQSPSVTSLKDLKGYRAIALFNGAWKSGELRNQNGIERAAYFKKAEDNKLYPREFGEIQIEYPAGGDRFSPLDELIEQYGWVVEEKKAGQTEIDRELRKAQKSASAKISKGFGSSSNFQVTPSHKSKGFSPVGRKVGVR